MGEDDILFHPYIICNNNIFVTTTTTNSYGTNTTGFGIAVSGPNNAATCM